MAVIGIKTDGSDQVKELAKEFNKNLTEANPPYQFMTGSVNFLDNIVIVNIRNLASPFDMPRRVTYWIVKYRWRKKGYKGAFRLVGTKKFLDILVSELWVKKKC